MLSRKVGKWDNNWREMFFYFYLHVGAIAEGNDPRERNRWGGRGPDRKAQEGGWAGSGANLEGRVLPLMVPVFSVRKRVRREMLMV